jgi:hypothetical protein
MAGPEAGLAMAEPAAVWNEITTDFDPEEETANFGTRHALEADGNLYEVRIRLMFTPEK